jgi:pimeloyl-ACP methyl ester carboxylesterase
MYSRAIHLNNAVLSYDVQGHGSRALLMFHGAGQDRGVFKNVPPLLTTEYRIYAFDLFFHGQSQWNNQYPVSKNDWKLLLEEFCSTEQVEKFSVLGYSIGARFALATLEVLPGKIHTCFLVAPDGMPNSPWFALATSTRLGRGIFKNHLNDPRRLHRLLRIGYRLGLIKSTTTRFVEHQLDSETKRWRIYQTWTSFRLLRFNLSSLQRVIQDGHVRLVVHLATQDELVAIAPIRTFLKRLKSAHLEVIDSNHRRVLTEALERIATLQR